MTKNFRSLLPLLVVPILAASAFADTVTLKSGIEGMLQRMVPEVTEVVAEMG